MFTISSYRRTVSAGDGYFLRKAPAAHEGSDAWPRCAGAFPLVLGLAPEVEFRVDVDSERLAFRLCLHYLPWKACGILPRQGNARVSRANQVGNRNTFQDLSDSEVLVLGSHASL